MTWKPGVYGPEQESAAPAPPPAGSGGRAAGIRRFRVRVGSAVYPVEVEELPPGGPDRGQAAPGAPRLAPRPGAIEGRPPWAGWGERGARGC